MTNFPNPEFPISSADCADIEAIYIELVSARDAAAAEAASVNATLPFADPQTNPQDLHS